MLAPTVIILLFITVYPFLRAIFMSLHEWNLAEAGGEHAFIGLANYGRALTTPRFWSSAANTFQLLVFAVGTQLVAGIMIAMLIDNLFTKGNKVIQGMVLIPMMLAPVVVGLLWKMMYNPQFGIFPYVLSIVGLPENIDFTGNPRLSLYSIIIADIWQWTPFVILVMLAGLKSIPDFLLESANIDGASGWQKFRFIKLPLLKPSLLVVILIRTMDAFKLFDKIYMLTMGGPGSSTETLSYYLYLQGFKNYKMGYASSITFLMLLFVIAFSFILIDVMRKGREEG
jgi:multiple sugar transport system permease protein